MTTIAIKINRLPQLFAALRALDGPATAPFKFSAKCTWNRVKAMKILRRELDTVEETGRKFLQDSSKDPDSPTKEEEEAANKAYFKLQQEIVEINGLLKFKVEDFNLFDPKDNKTGNLIGAAILAELDILTEDLPLESEIDKPALAGPEDKS